MKKKLQLAPLMAVLVACVVVLSGCGGPSIEELITEDLTTQFDEVKNGGDEFLSGLEEASGDEFEQLGIDPKEYAKTYLEGFDYEIGDVTVDEDKGVATAEVSITCKSMNKIVEDFSTQYQEKVAALDTVPSDDELYKMAGQVMVDVTKATEPRKKVSYTGLALARMDRSAGMCWMGSPSMVQPVHILISSRPSRISSRVIARASMEFSRAAYFTMKASSQPQRRGRPVTVPNSWPVFRR